MFGSKSVVDLLVRGGKIEIAVALNGDFAVNSAFGFCDLLFDSAQAASGPIIGPDPRKVDTSGVSYAALVSVAEFSASKTSGAERLHQECRRRVL